MRVVAADEPVVSIQDLERVPLLRRLDPTQRQLVLDAAEVLEADAGETVVSEGDRGGDLFILLSGTGVILTRSEEGDPIQVGTVQPGETFGELGALLDAPRTATIMLADAGRLLRLNAPPSSSCSIGSARSASHWRGNWPGTSRSHGGNAMRCGSRQRRTGWSSRPRISRGPAPTSLATTSRPCATSFDATGCDGRHPSALRHRVPGPPRRAGGLGRPVR